MSGNNYQPRVGSVCYRAFEHLEAFGPTAEAALADACDVDVAALRSSVNLAVTARAMSREAINGQLVYSSTRPRPTVISAPPAPPAEPPAAPAAEPAPAPIWPQGIVSTVETPREVIEAIAGPSSPDPSLPKSIDAKPIKRPFAFALWSDGRLALEIDSIAHTLDLEETRRLFDYLDRMRVDDEGDRG